MSELSAALSRLREYGESVLKNLPPSDPRLARCVRLLHRDGSRSTVAHATIEATGQWLLIFSPVEGLILFRKNDIVEWHSDDATAYTAIAVEPVIWDRNAVVRAA